MTRLTNWNQYSESESRKKVPAWLLSAIFHFLLVLLAAWFTQKPGGNAAVSDEADRKVAIALVNPNQNRNEYLTEEDSRESSDNEQSTSDAVQAALPAMSQLDDSLPGFLPNDSDVGEIGADLGKGLVGADGFLDGIAKGPKKGGDTGQTTTSVFGIKGTGTRFVYVFDRSGSMVAFGGKPLIAAKSQLVASLESLGPKQQFQIIFYNERPRAFTPKGGRPKLLYATDENKRAARKFISAIPGGGATRHLPALKMAVDFAPDVVFFLTDAAEPIISDDNLRVIDRWNRNAAVIHAIEFGTAGSPLTDNFLKKLARANGGNYVYENVTLFNNQ